MNNKKYTVDTVSEVRRVKKVPFTVIDVKDKQEIVAWQAEADRRLLKRQAEARDKAISWMHTDLAMYSLRDIRYDMYEKPSIFQRVKRRVSQWFSNLWRSAFPDA